MNRLRLVGIVALFVGPTLSLSPGLVAQTGAAMTTFNWTLNNFDISGHRYVTPTQITRDNVKTLVQATRSPFFTDVTSVPTALTTPAPSCPNTNGGIAL